jgi:hypothetical protein
MGNHGPGVSCCGILPGLSGVTEMNGRFVQLAYEAKLFNGMPAPVKEVEKFAELIVRECMNICAEREEDIRTRIKDERQAATAYMCRAYIKEHFGVEE